MPQPLPHQRLRRDRRAAERVWDVVGDVTRMPEWSPELRRLRLARARARPGSAPPCSGLNRRGWVAWPTTSTVTRLEPGRAVAWRTRESGATWTYELEAAGGGTRLTGRRDLPAFSLAPPCSGRSSGERRATTRSSPPASAPRWSGSRTPSRR